jgi:hypothetical protein
MPTPIAVKNMVLAACNNDLRVAADLCLKVRFVHDA